MMLAAVFPAAVGPIKAIQGLICDDDCGDSVDSVDIRLLPTQKQAIERHHIELNPSGASVITLIAALGVFHLP